MFRVLLLAAVACLGVRAPVRAQTVLTLEDVIARAREQSGRVLVARARVAESEAGLIGASAIVRENPTLEASAGPRLMGPGRSTELDIGISQQFETGGQRSARTSVARAGIDRERAVASHVARTAVFESALTFLDGVAATERLQIAEEADAVSRELLGATERRYAVGDIAAIDLNLARIEAARSAASLRAARAGLIAAMGALRAQLRLPAAEPVELRGSLDLPAPPPLAQVRAAVEQRPDFSALAAEAREAEAQAQLARALRQPAIGVRAGYAREETDTIVLGGLVVALPVFRTNRGAIDTSLARAARARVELDAARQQADVELGAAYADYEQHSALARAFLDDALASAADNEGLARRSYEAGELPLMDYLLLRRDALETRTLAIDRRLEAARRRLRVDYLAGVLQ